MPLIVAFIFIKKRPDVPDLSYNLFTKNGVLYDKGTNIGWKKMSINMMIYLFNILSETLNIEFEEVEYIKLTKENIEKLVKVSDINQDIFINEFSLALNKYEDYLTSLLIINKDDILDYLGEYDLSKHDLSDSFMLIESLDHEFDFSTLQISRLFIHMKKYGYLVE